VTPPSFPDALVALSKLSTSENAPKPQSCGQGSSATGVMPSNGQSGSMFYSSGSEPLKWRRWNGFVASGFFFRKVARTAAENYAPSLQDISFVVFFFVCVSCHTFFRASYLNTKILNFVFIAACSSVFLCYQYSCLSLFSTCGSDDFLLDEACLSYVVCLWLSLLWFCIVCNESSDEFSSVTFTVRSWSCICLMLI